MTLLLLAGVGVLSFEMGIADYVQAANGTNRQVSYQGKLLDSTGIVVSNATYQMKFSLYTAATGGTAVWTASGTAATPTAIPVAVQNGLFSIMLGDTSAAGMWQNALDSVDWNSDSLYLGVTIASDVEMTPRKRIGAVAQALNAERLQGMFASSTASGGQTLFTVNQTENNAATGTRTALLVRSSGTSSANDYLVRGLDDSGSQVLSINRQGSVTSSGVFAFSGSGTSTVSGSLSVLGNVSSTVLYAANATLVALGTTTLNATGLVWTNATGTNTTSTNLYVSNWLQAVNVSSTSLTWTNATGTNTTSTNLYVSTLLQFANASGTNVSSTSLAVTGAATSTFNGSVSVRGMSSSTRAVVDENFTVYGSTTLGDASTDSLTVNAAVASNLVSATDATYNFGSASVRWNNGFFVNVTSTYATSTWLFAQNATIPTLTATNATITNGTSTTWYTTSLEVQNVSSSAVTSTTLYATRSTLASVTSTNLYTTGLEFQNASGTTATSTNLNVLRDARITLTGTSQIPSEASVSFTGIPNRMVSDDRYVAIMATSTFAVQFFSVVSSTPPVSVFGRQPGGNTIRDLALQAGLLYTIYSGDSTFYISDPVAGTNLSSLSLSFAPVAMRVIGRYAYVVGGTSLSIIDIANPRVPTVLMTNTNASTRRESIEVHGGYAFIGDNLGAKMQVVDVSQPMAIAGTIDPLITLALASSTVIKVHGNTLYMVDNLLLRVVDISQPSSPATLGTLSLTGARDVEVIGNYAFVAYNSGVAVVDVHDGLNPTLIKTISVNNAQGVHVRGRTLFVSDAQPNNTLRTYRLPGLETTSLIAHAGLIGQLQVLGDGRIGHSLDVTNGITVGLSGILSQGAIGVSATNTTSTIMGNLLVGTSTRGNILNAAFVMNGDDLLVGGNIGSASSVYTNGSFIAGSGSTMYGNGFVVRNDGNLSVSSSAALTFGSNLDAAFTLGGAWRVSSTNLTVSATAIRPVSDAGVELGSASLRFDGQFRFATTTHGTTTNAFITTARVTDATITNGTSTTWYTTSLEMQNASSSAVTSTTLYATRSTLASATSTNFYTTGLEFQNASGTSATSTTLFATRATFSAATSTVLYSTQLYTDDGSALIRGGTSIPQIASIAIGVAPGKVILDDRFAVVLSTSTNQFVLFDVTSSTRPVSLGTFSSGGTGFTDGAVQNHLAYFVHTDDSFRIYDIKDGVVRAMGTITSGLDDPQSIAVQGRYAYVVQDGTSDSLIIIDIADPARPRIIASLATSSTDPRKIAVQGRYAYIYHNGDTSIRTYDVANPYAPYVLSGSISAFGAAGLVAQGGYLYGGGTGGIDVIVTRVPGTLATTGLFSTPTDIESMALSGRYLFAARGGIGLSIIDTANTASLSILQNIGSITAQGVAVRGRYMYVTRPGTNTLLVYRLPGAELAGLETSMASIGLLQVLADGKIAHHLEVGDGLAVGFGGIRTQGALGVAATNTTSTIMGNLAVGTSTMDVALHAAFIMNGDDLFVGGNIGSVSSVYTNGSFIAGTGSTFYNAGSIINNSGNLTVSSTSNLVLNANGQITVGAPSGIIPSLDATPFGNSSARFDGYFRNATATTWDVSGSLRTVPSDANGFTVVTSAYLGSATYQPRSMALAGTWLYVGESNSKNLFTYDVSNPNLPVQQANPISLGTPVPNDLAVSGGYLYLAGGTVMQVYSLLNPALPVLVGSVTLTSAQDIAVMGNYAYVSSDGTGLYVIDVSRPWAPVIVNYDTTVLARDVQTDGRYVYTANTSGKFYKLDVTYPSSLTSSTATFASNAASLVLHNGFAYVGSNSATAIITVFDVSTAAPTNVNAFSSTSGVSRNGMFASGRYLYVADGGSGGKFRVFDILNASSTVSLGSVSNGASGNNFGIVGSGRYIYVGDTGSNQIDVIRAPGLETPALESGLLQGGQLMVTDDGRVAGALRVDNGLLVGGNTHFQGLFAVTASSTSSTARFINTASHDAIDTSWSAYIDRLLVGEVSNATGTEDYMMLIAYDSGAKRAGICLRDTTTGGCPDADGLGSTSIIADHAITANGFDVAEMYRAVGEVTSTDVLVMDAVSSTTVRRSMGVAYDAMVIGVASTKPAFVLGFSGTPVALTGRVPTKVSTVNGAIAIGDALTTSEYPGIAMKATKPGMILGHALESAMVTSTIEVFVRTGYWAGTVLNTDGTVARITDDVTLEARGTATVVNTTRDSWGLTFRGSAWNGETAQSTSFGLLTQVASVTSSSLVVRNASSTSIWSVDQGGSMTIAGDVVVGGRLYPSGRGAAQRSKYIFLDDTSTSTQYIATNADGWQANDSYDFAERYYSPDKLETGDVVIASDRGRLHVQRSWDETTMLMGIVSTRPAFVAGKPEPNTYPVALAGRVPTKVSGMNGAIKAGDPLAASTIPGVAVKAASAGPIVGLALENYDAPVVGRIEVFVNPGWWGGARQELAGPAASASHECSPDGLRAYGNPACASPTNSWRLEGEALVRSGFAVVVAGAKSVHLSFESVMSYPNVQVTPRGQVKGGWWVDGYTDVGFDLYLNEEQTRDVTFAWNVQGTPQGARVYRSDGTYAAVNPTTGEAVMQTMATSTGDKSKDLPLRKGDGELGVVAVMDATSSTEAGVVSAPEPVAVTTTTAVTATSTLESSSSVGDTEAVSPVSSGSTSTQEGG